MSGLKIAFLLLVTLITDNVLFGEADDGCGFGSLCCSCCGARRGFAGVTCCIPSGGGCRNGCRSDNLICPSTSDDDNVGDLFPFLDISGFFASLGNGRTLSTFEIPSDCVNADYELLFVGVGRHLVVAALSEYVGTDKVTNCPSNLVFHQSSVYEKKDVQSVKKEVLEVSEDELAQHEDRLSLGSFSLGNIFESFNNANSEEKVYNTVSHNCASLLIEMAIGFGIDPTDKSIVTYAANHLFDKANSFMMDGLSQNDFRLAFEDHANVQADQYGIIEDFVKTYIDERV